MLLLTRDDVERLVTMPDAIAIMRSLFVELGQGAVDLPERTVLDVGSAGGAALFMPAHVPAMRGLGLKVVGVFPENPTAHRLPLVIASILLLDPSTGQVAAMVDGTWLTALRTAAVSAVASERLARADARDLLVFGAGVQARSHVSAMLEVRGIERVTVVAPRRAAVDAAVADLKQAHGHRCAISGATDAGEALDHADIVVTVTTSRRPVFDGSRLRPGTHVNAVGSFKPDVQEVDEIAVSRARVFVDHRASALAEAGDLLVPIARGVIAEGHVLADLGDLACARHPGRTASDEITLFKSVGLAAEDVAVAGFVFERALAEGRGRSIAW